MAIWVHWVQEIELQVNKVVNPKVSLSEGDITKINVDVTVNGAKGTLVDGGGTNENSHKAEWPVLLDKYQKLNSFKND